jgi:hypothetical protein
MQLPDKCSFEWAKKLNDAGYPQPAYAPGQLWYDKFGRPLLISAMYTSGVFQVTNMKTGDGGRVMELRDGQVYAPGVEELMKQVCVEVKTFALYYKKSDTFGIIEDNDVAPSTELPIFSDALAGVWLMNYGQKEETELNP